ncbi:hypothetical protein LTR53_016520 [Teratosphaeriaceae sp. CCFEE 6253]|nr:hypothetical protein LTR53_016520 [Teratosphaeriaceae sp. CCFEE 6253]
MAPDLNSLPPSPTTASAAFTTPATLQSHPRRISLSNAGVSAGSPPRSPPLSSLQAAATINRGLHRSPSSNPSPVHPIERRRSSLMNNLSMNDPAVPAPGELQQPSSNSSSPRLGRRSIALLTTADPHHHQPPPSLGELHQELENEQEAQVNRLLHMIRLQQDQLASLQQRQPPPAAEPSPTSSTEPPRFPTPPSTLRTPAAGPSTTEQPAPSSSSSRPGSAAHVHFHPPPPLSRPSSARLSSAGSRGTTSPALRPVSGSGGLGPRTEDFLLGGGGGGGARDECAFYQAETQTLTRENQMLKLRIRELERQVTDMSGSGGGAGGNGVPGLAHSPAPTSPRAHVPATVTGQEAPALSAPVEPLAKVD